MPIPLAAPLLAGLALPYAVKAADEFILAPAKEYGKRFGKWITGSEDKKAAPEDLRSALKQPNQKGGAAFSPPDQSSADPAPTERTPAFSTGGDQAVIDAGQAPMANAAPAANGPPTPLGPQQGGSEFLGAMQDTMGQLHDNVMSDGPSDMQVQGWGPGEGEGRTSSVWGGQTYGGNKFGGNKFGGQTYGGNKFGGNQFGASQETNGINRPSPRGAFQSDIPSANPPPDDSLMPDQIASGAAPGPSPVSIAAREPPMPSGRGLTQPNQSAGAVERTPGLARSRGPMGGGGGAAFVAPPTDTGPTVNPPHQKSAFGQPAAVGPATSGAPKTAFSPPTPAQQPGQPPAPGQPAGGGGDPSIAIATAVSNSPNMKEAVQNPSSVFPDPDKYINMMLKEGEFDDQTSNKISSMTQDEKSEMLMEMGLRMMVAGGEGRDPFAAFGAAGLGAMDTFRANRGQQRLINEKHADRRANVYGKAAEITQQGASARARADAAKAAAQQRADAARAHDATTIRGQDLAAQTAEANRASQEAQQRIQSGATVESAKISANRPSDMQRDIDALTAEYQKQGMTEQEARTKAIERVNEHHASTQANNQGEASRLYEGLRKQAADENGQVTAEDEARIRASVHEKFPEVPGYLPLSGGGTQPSAQPGTQPQQSQPQGTQDNPYLPKSKEERDKLPPGSYYRDPSGNLRQV